MDRGPSSYIIREYHNQYNIVPPRIKIVTEQVSYNDLNEAIKIAQSFYKKRFDSCLNLWDAFESDWSNYCGSGSIHGRRESYEINIEFLEQTI